MAVIPFHTCLAILLVKLRTGLSNNLLATLFSLKCHQIQRAVHSARQHLMNNFVPHFLGFKHISHSDFVAKHTTRIASDIFSNNIEDCAILVIDGTYIYIQKSGNHRLQKLTYSLHKNRSLVKPMLIVGTDGYILDVFGPYFADFANNDAAITKHAYESNQHQFRSWLKDDDVFIVDRGFRDVIEFLKENNFHVEMPSFLKKGEKQFTTEEANTSRLVTKVRWVVESANGRLKQWKLLEKVVPNHYVPCIGDFVRIVSALINCFRSPLISDISENNIGITMLEKSKLQNHVKQIVEDNGLLTKRRQFEEINGNNDILDFPHLNEQELRDITMGVYQVKLAPRYTENHFGEDDGYQLFVWKEQPNLLRIRIQSRHTSSKIYSVWIEYNEFEVSGWYCTCKVGARVVGCCCHVASIIWYLGLDRWDNDSTGKRSDLSSSVLDARNTRAEVSDDELLSDDNDIVEE